MQIRHYITSHKENKRLRRKPNDIDQYFIAISQKGFPVSRHVSHLYKRFSSDIFQNTYDIKEKWELESNTVIEDEVWDKLCDISHKGISSQQWREFDWKLKTRFFFILPWLYLILSRTHRQLYAGENVK